MRKIMGKQTLRDVLSMSEFESLLMSNTNDELAQCDWL